MTLLRRAGLIIVMITCSCLLATNARAALDAQGRQEVNALLAFVGSSPCTFIRNGKSYGAADARAHLQTKLDYLLARDQLDSAEQFIDRAGSKSSLSGEPYRVNCDGRERLSADWLKDELQRLRARRP